MTYDHCCCKIPNSRACPYCRPELARAVQEYEARCSKNGYRISSLSWGAGSTEVIGEFRQTAPHISTKQSQNGWMSPRIRRFYDHLDRRHKLDKELAGIDPTSNFGRRLKLDREEELLRQDLQLISNREAKCLLHARLRRRDPWSNHVPRLSQSEIQDALASRHASFYRPAKVRKPR